MSGIESLPPLHKISFQIRILLLKNLCKAPVCRLLLPAAALALGEGGMVRLSFLFCHCLSLCLSGFGVVVTLYLFRSLSLMCLPPPFYVSAVVLPLAGFL